MRGNSDPASPRSICWRHVVSCSARNASSFIGSRVGPHIVLEALTLRSLLPRLRKCSTGIIPGIDITHSAKVNRWLQSAPGANVRFASNSFKATQIEVKSSRNACTTLLGVVCPPRAPFDPPLHVSSSPPPAFACRRMHLGM